MMIYWIKRIGLTLALAVPVWFALNMLAYVIFCGLAGPWGAALDGLNERDIPSYTVYLAWALQVMLILGPLLIGWKWSGKIMSRHAANVMGDS